MRPSGEGPPGIGPVEQLQAQAVASADKTLKEELKKTEATIKELQGEVVHYSRRLVDTSQSSTFYLQQLAPVSGAQFKGVQSRVVMAEWLARWTPNHKIVGSSPAKSQSAHQNRPLWAMGGDNGASVHSAINEYLAITEMAIVPRLPVAP